MSTHTTPCEQHPDRDATWRCSSCRRELCGDCVRLVRHRLGELGICPHCTEPCESLIPSTREEDDDRPFHQRLPEIALYPLRSQHRAAFLPVTATLLLCGWLTAYNVFFIIAAPIVIGWFSSFALDITRAAAGGDRLLPMMRIPQHIAEDLLRPLLFGSIIIVPMWATPVLAYGHWPPMTYNLFVLAVYTIGPMALLAIASWESVHALDPRLVLGGIIRTLPGYLLLIPLWGVGSVICVNCVMTAETAVYTYELSGWATVPAALIFTYTAMVMFHMLGQFHHANRHRLAWFLEQRMPVDYAATNEPDLDHVCDAHPDQPAPWRCEHCETWRCDGCVRLYPSGYGNVASCRDCGEMCTPAAPAKGRSREPRPGRPRAT